MKSFAKYLQEIDKLKKQRQYDKAWKLAHKALVDFLKRKDESWFMFYYQLADISAREKRWMDALFFMSLVTHYLQRLGGVTHEKFIKRLLKKYGKEDRLEDFIKFSIQTPPERLGKKIKELLLN